MFYINSLLLILQVSTAHPRIDFRPCCNPGKKVQKIREQNHRGPLDCSKNIFITQKVLILFSSNKKFPIFEIFVAIWKLLKLGKSQSKLA